MILLATEADLDRILTLEALSHPHPWSRASFLEELQHQGARTLFLKRGEPVAAYIVAWRIADELQIQNVTTDPSARRQGHAKALLEAVLAHPHTEATLEVRAGNSAAFALYSALGFITVGERPRYYSNGDNAILMQRALF